MIVKSYIKQGSEFFPVEDFDGKIVDPDYLEGAIEITINSKQLFTKSMWDYVDQLWEYLIDATNESVKKKESRFYFPDQPIETTISFSRQRQLVTVTVRINQKTDARIMASIPLCEFVPGLCQAAETFFNKLIMLAPSHSSTYIHALEKVKQLRAVYVDTTKEAW